jgi:hypothetical protein
MTARTCSVGMAKPTFSTAVVRLAVAVAVTRPMTLPWLLMRGPPE